ncbi:hypothetical protein BDV19DRAFT_33691 [Aspergillus venezuelensis]
MSDELSDPGSGSLERDMESGVCSSERSVEYVRGREDHRGFLILFPGLKDFWSFETRFCCWLWLQHCVITMVLLLLLLLTRAWKFDSPGVFLGKRMGLSLSFSVLWSHRPKYQQRT